MREILFRGKTNKGEWFYGMPIATERLGIFAIQTFNHGAIVYIIPETIGQYTGLTDKNGTKIFEGDIVKAQDNLITSPFCDGIIGKIVYDECAFFIEPANPIETQWLFNECADYEVIGNIHDNPELLKECEGK